MRRRPLLSSRPSPRRCCHRECDRDPQLQWERCSTRLAMDTVVELALAQHCQSEVHYDVVPVAEGLQVALSKAALVSGPLPPLLMPRLLLLLPPTTTTRPPKPLAAPTSPACSKAPQIYPPGSLRSVPATNNCRDTPSGTAVVPLHRTTAFRAGGRCANTWCKQAARPPERLLVEPPSQLAGCPRLRCRRRRRHRRRRHRRRRRCRQHHECSEPLGVATARIASCQVRNKPLRTSGGASRCSSW